MKSNNQKVVNKITLKRGELPSTELFIENILKGNISYLSRAITLVESTKKSHQKIAAAILKGCLSNTDNSIRIGITGVPGVGKSTFIEAFGTYAAEQGKRVAVLAVDPSSSISKGSILGDKTRMEKLVNNPNVFIRPSPAGESLGGVARKTRETILLCEAAGFDTIIVETVGVGQSETAVHSMVDFFLLLKLAGAGDELQGVKRGIIEMADAIVINKADGDNIKNAKLAKTEFTRALHLYPPKESSWQPKVTTCSALENKGIKEVWELISSYFDLTKTNNHFETLRNAQNKKWVLDTIDDELKEQFYSSPNIKKLLKDVLLKVENNQITVVEAASRVLIAYNNRD
ncbi:methylmalonyl Co-A mutase-associated GTPase MeaB [Aureibaculum sp. 2210JD6-5]|uniref:methylmalonyl Co-A mutase-associated GTPase MeaB n=1 Tax=Aureibaculum sp. 2210JD6-5 TaxID=3103957 RepID=UPI002AAC974E|nr:methylmalonyl Co-A mutase-associated GTPase MeaB [Aureibaculum sp. 2210JD6-5]MDY7395176.1 methylmalonyl Co-A mutase-associated GTPase MeaB [Aureibaculum sp. 2210JD6-5]